MRNYTNNLISNIAGKKIIIAGINGYIGSEFSDQLNISKERVRQIEVRAMEKLKKSVKNLLIKQNLEKKEAVNYIN